MTARQRTTLFRGRGVLPEIIVGVSTAGPNAGWGKLKRFLETLVADSIDWPLAFLRS
jgi:hypothetical protein